ncbi:hypothetical protein BWQ93_11825 [Sphingopyxis sp. QXT-31]|nr:hypothetical protein BWQ93_11825 [Sphingopyxis sp. QXT-31]
MGEEFKSRFPGAFDVGEVLFELAQGCYAFEAFTYAAASKDAEIAIPALPVGAGASGTLSRVDGSEHIFDLRYYFELGKDHAFTRDGIARSWYCGVLISAGDLLAAHQYFDHQPEFELLYHVRNAVAHGNRFHITEAGKKRLEKYPAYLRFYDGSDRFQLSPDLDHQRILFDFMQAGDVADLLSLVGERLRDLERGILGPGVNTSIFG